jgi:hypothetical protein
MLDGIDVNAPPPSASAAPRMDSGGPAAAQLLRLPQGIDVDAQACACHPSMAGACFNERGNRSLVALEMTVSDQLVESRPENLSAH